MTLLHDRADEGAQQYGPRHEWSATAHCWRCHAWQAADGYRTEDAALRALKRAKWHKAECEQADCRCRIGRRCKGGNS